MREAKTSRRVVALKRGRDGVSLPKQSERYPFVSRRGESKAKAGEITAFGNLPSKANECTVIFYRE